MVDFSQNLNSSGKAESDEGVKKDEAPKSDETQQLPNVPKDAAGNYDPDKAAPGGYNLPTSAGVTAEKDAFEKKDEEAGVEKEPAKVVSDEAVKPEIPHGGDQAERNQEKLDNDPNAADGLPGADKVIGKPGRKPKL